MASGRNFSRRSYGILRDKWRFHPTLEEFQNEESEEG